MQPSHPHHARPAGRFAAGLGLIVLAWVMVVPAAGSAEAVPATSGRCVWHLSKTVFPGWLHGVAVVKSTEVLAVGYDSTGALALRFTGGWHRVAVPDLPQAELLGVATVPGTERAWAVGDQWTPDGMEPLVEHWNGASWAVVSSPAPGSPSSLHGVMSFGPSDAWAVGTYEDNTLIEHWDGSGWTVVPSPTLPHQGALFDVAGASPTDVWAVGDRSANGERHALVEHWDGTQWTRVPLPIRGAYDDSLVGVAASSPTNVWAVGSRGNTDSTLALRLGSGGWSVVPSPTATGRGALGFNDVQIVGPGDVWSVGWKVWGNGTLSAHWDGSAWSLVPVTGIGALGDLSGIAVDRSTGRIWAVGEGNAQNTVIVHRC